MTTFAATAVVVTTGVVAATAAATIRPIAAVAEGGIQIDAVTGIGLVVFMGGIIGLLFKMFVAGKDALISTKDALLIAKDAEFAAMVHRRDEQTAVLASAQKSYQEIASEALKSALETANYYRQRDGQPPLVPLAQTVPESHSPSTHEQRITADIATMRATMAMIRLETGQKVRPTPERAAEPPKTAKA